jgi:hypothetical protein
MPVLTPPPKLGFPCATHSLPSPSIKKLCQLILSQLPQFPPSVSPWGFWSFVGITRRSFFDAPVLFQIEQTEKMVAEPLVHAALWYEKKKRKKKKRSIENVQYAIILCYRERRIPYYSGGFWSSSRREAQLFFYPTPLAMDA